MHTHTHTHIHTHTHTHQRWDPPVDSAAVDEARELLLTHTQTYTHQRWDPPVDGAAVDEARELLLAHTHTHTHNKGGTHQSIVQPLMRPGNCCARRLNLSPTGEKHSTMCRLSRTRFRKKVYLEMHTNIHIRV